MFGCGLPPSPRHFLNPRLMSFPSSEFCQLPLEPYRVCFMEMSPARTAITGTAAIIGTMQNGSNSGESKNQQSSLGTGEQSHFLPFAVNMSIRPQSQSECRAGWWKAAYYAAQLCSSRVLMDRAEEASSAQHRHGRPWVMSAEGDTLRGRKRTSGGQGPGSQLQTSLWKSLGSRGHPLLSSTQTHFSCRRSQSSILFFWNRFLSERPLKGPRTWVYWMHSLSLFTIL